MKTKRETNRIVYVLVAVCIVLLLHGPMFEWWCETEMGKFLNGINAFCFLDTIALLLIMLGCGVAIEIPGLLSETGKHLRFMVHESSLMVNGYFNLDANNNCFEHE